jgi:hypothetical protein
MDEHLALDEGMRSSTDEVLQVPLFAPRHLTLNAGPKSSIGDLTFNPNFSDWIMGWPIGWTDPTRPVSGWSVWLRRMRNELSKMPI